MSNNLFSKDELYVIFVLVFAFGFGILVNLFTGGFYAARCEENAMIENCVKLPLELNSCAKEDLVALKKVGPALAARIVDYRDKNGGFKTRCELKNVSGIGENMYAAIKESVYVPGDPSPDNDYPDEVSDDDKDAEKINLNFAEVENFANIKGLGKKIGEKIIAFREKCGGKIEKMSSLSAIEGIGKKRARRIARHFFIQ